MVRSLQDDRSEAGGHLHDNVRESGRAEGGRGRVRGCRPGLQHQQHADLCFRKERREGAPVLGRQRGHAAQHHRPA